MKSTLLKVSLSCAALAMALPASAAVLTENFNLGGTSQTTSSWTDLSTFNTLAPDSGPGTLAISGAFQASYGIYSFASDYNFTTTQGASYDIQNVVLQVELSPNTEFTFPYGAGPLLSINGGQYVIAPDMFKVGASESRNTFGATPLVYEDAVWQWNLSGITDTVTSVSILTPVSIHTSTVGVQIDTSNSFNGFVNPVPEPSAALLSFLGLGALLRRRR